MEIGYQSIAFLFTCSYPSHFTLSLLHPSTLSTNDKIHKKLYSNTRCKPTSPPTSPPPSLHSHTHTGKTTTTTTTTITCNYHLQLSPTTITIPEHNTPPPAPCAAPTMSKNPATDPYSSAESLETDLSEDTTWISWFSQLKGNEFFCQVDEDFIQDDFNLTGLSSQVAYYNYALDTILDVDIPDGELDDRQQEMVEVSAETLYGLVHARYILTARGMDSMRAKFSDGSFGRCPRVYCKGQHVLPVGLSDIPRCSTVKIFCPMCWDLFFPRSRSHNSLDGAYWGTTFPHIFLHTNYNLVPPRNHDKYIPRIFGFKIHHSAIQVQNNLNPQYNDVHQKDSRRRQRNAAATTTKR